MAFGGGGKDWNRLGSGNLVVSGTGRFGGKFWWVMPSEEEQQQAVIDFVSRAAYYMTISRSTRPERRPKLMLPSHLSLRL